MFPPQIIIVDCNRRIARRCVSNLTRPDQFDKEKAPESDGTIIRRGCLLHCIFSFAGIMMSASPL
jgi:hypothetical protein